ncbi:MAG TPA: DNA-formamidopyrimidine glycosylase family protein [Polyangiaceae bacterium]|nr:DNA-formamidopyrimidine glycosylase family protein [Polyangiaceae bacterium]
MPEGDTLHLAARQLSPRLTGKTVRALELVRRTDSTDGVIGQTVTGVEARGKNLLVHFEGGFSLHVHLKMNGRILVYRQLEGRKPGPEAVAVLDTDEHRIIVSHAPVARLIRTRDLVRDLHFRHLGPDLIADRFELEEALLRLRLRKEMPLGEALLDQSAVAGIGNVWKSELCFNLKLDPFAPVAAATEEELSALLIMARKLMIETVERAPRRLPDPFAPRQWQRHARLNHRLGQKRLSVYERAGERCYDCGSTIQVQPQGEQLRRTYYCPTCQPSRRTA